MSSEVKAGRQVRAPTKPRIQEVLRRIDGGRVLDIGCVGHDSYLKEDSEWLHSYLHGVSDDLVGIDVDEGGIQDLQKDGWDVHVDDATELESVRGPFDTVVAGEVIEHLSNPGGLFDAARDVLNEDGTLLLSTPNPWAFCYIKRMAMGGDPVGNEEHTCWIDESTLLELATRHGFEGTIEHLEPMGGGISSGIYRLGHQKLGGTRLFAEFEVAGDD